MNNTPTNTETPAGGAPPAQEADWMETLKDECAICFVPFHPDDPAKTMRGLIRWHVNVATDPRLTEVADDGSGLSRMLLAGVMLLVVAVACLAAAAHSQGIASAREDAVQAGAAFWVPKENGSTEFHWRTNR